MTAASVLHEVVIDEWWLDTEQKLVLSLVAYAGEWRCVLVIWSRAEDGTLNPSVSFSVHVEHLERLATAMKKAHRGAVERDVI
jgi:hypothetical protein